MLRAPPTQQEPDAAGHQRLHARFPQSTVDTPKPIHRALLDATRAIMHPCKRYHIKPLRYTARTVMQTKRNRRCLSSDLAGPCSAGIPDRGGRFGAVFLTTVFGAWPHRGSRAAADTGSALRWWGRRPTSPPECAGGGPFVPMSRRRCPGSVASRSRITTCRGLIEVVCH